MSSHSTTGWLYTFCVHALWRHTSNCLTQLPSFEEYDPFSIDVEVVTFTFVVLVPLVVQVLS